MQRLRNRPAETVARFRENEWYCRPAKEAFEALYGMRGSMNLSICFYSACS